MARSVADLALFLEALAGGDARDPLSGFTRGADFAGLKPAALEGLRFAVSEDLGFAPVSRRVRALFRDRVARLSKVVACEAADPPLAGPGRAADRDRKSVGEGKGGSVRLDRGGRRILKKKN